MADWTVNDPEVIAKNLQVSGNNVSSRVEVTFFDDTTPTPNERTITFSVRGASVMPTVEQLAWRVQQGLNGLEGVTIGTFTPVDPTTPTDQAIEDAKTARRKMVALQDVKTLFGMDANAQLGTSGITVTQAENALESDVFADVTNAARLAILLETLPVAVE